MMRLIPKKLWFCITVGMLVFQFASWGQWSSAPPIKIFYLCQEYDQDWFHISQSCRLWIEAEDRDSINDTLQPDNRIKPDQCSWYGNNLSDRVGLETTWEPTHITRRANVVYAMVNDNPDYSGGANTDDNSVLTPSTSLNAWEVAGTLSVEGMSKTITESGNDYPTSDSLSGNLNGGPRTADTSPYANDTDPYNMTVQVDATFNLHKRPSNVETFAATGAANVSGSMSGTLNASTDDDDFDPFGGGSMSFDVNKGFTADIHEGCESVACIKFGFYSNALTSHSGHPEHRVGKASGDYTNDGSTGFSHQSSRAIGGLLSSNGVTKRAQIQINGYVKAGGYKVYVPEMGQWVYFNSKASISSSGSYTFTLTNASASNLWYAPKTRYIPSSKR